MRHIARKRARRRSGEAVTQWPDLLAALARGEARSATQTHDTLAGVLGELEALRQDPAPQIVVLIDEVDVLAQQACEPLGADIARLLLEMGRSSGVALALVESRPTATWFT